MSSSQTSSTTPHSTTQTSTTKTTLSDTSTSTATSTGSSSTGSSTTTFSSTTTVTTATVTPERFSKVVSAISLAYPVGLSNDEVKDISQKSLASLLKVEQEKLLILQVKQAIENFLNNAPVSRRGTSRSSAAYDIDYEVTVPGTETDGVEGALTELVENPSQIMSHLQESMAEVVPNVSTAGLQVLAVEPPVVQLWMFTTATDTTTTETSISATHTSGSHTSSTTLSSTTGSSTSATLVCSLPDIGVPAGVGPFSETSGRPDLLRLECTGQKDGDTCAAVCQTGFSTIGEMVCDFSENFAFVGNTSCIEADCQVPQDLGIGYEPAPPECNNIAYNQKCPITCSDGYENLGAPLELICTASQAYEFAPGSGRCTPSRCYESSVPLVQNAVNLSSCIEIESGQECTPECAENHLVTGSINCSFGVLTAPPLLCRPTSSSGTIKTTDILLVDTAIVATTNNSGLTGQFARDNEVHVKKALAQSFDVYHGQVYFSRIVDLNTDYTSRVPARRLQATQEGVFLSLYIQLYPIDNADAIVANIAELESTGSNFTGILEALLLEAGVAVPPGLAFASLHTSTPVSSTAELPVAYWLPLTPWSECSCPCASECGEGVESREVKCVLGDEVLCNANAAPTFTEMPSERVCKTYAKCPYDPFCPGGPDPVTGKGCNEQTAAVASAMTISGAVVACIFCRYLIKWSKRPMHGKVRVKLDKDGKETQHIEWTRQHGIINEEGVQGKERLHYELTESAFLKYGGVSERGAGNAILTAKGQDPIMNVDIDFSGKVEFELHVKVRTFSSNAVLVGKCFPRGEPIHKGGEAKALLLKNGKAAFQIGEDFLEGTTKVNDGQQHNIVLRYHLEKEEYVLIVDNKIDGRGLTGYGEVPDSPFAKLVIGGPGAPRDDTFNELMPIMSSLSDLGVEVLQLEERLEAPLFDGDLDEVLWKERRPWDAGVSTLSWLEFELTVSSEEGPEDAFTKQASDRKRSLQYNAGPIQAFDVNQTVEYWSKTMGAWLPAKIVRVNRVYHDDDLAFRASSYDVDVGAAGQRVHNVPIQDLRVPFFEGESVSVFSHKHGRWYPATIHRSGRDLDHKLGYDVMLEDSDLKRDMEKHTRKLKLLQQQDDERSGRSPSPDADGADDIEAAVGVPAPKRKPDNVPSLDLGRLEAVKPPNVTDDDPMPALKNMPAKRLRRRFTEGQAVRLYQGLDTGFVEATVVKEVVDQKPRKVAVGVEEIGTSARGGSARHARGASARKNKRNPTSLDGPMAPGAMDIDSDQGSDDGQPAAPARPGETKMRYDLSEQRWCKVRIKFLPDATETTEGADADKPGQTFVWDAPEVLHPEDQDTGAGVGQMEPESGLLVSEALLRPRSWTTPRGSKRGAIGGGGLAPIADAPEPSADDNTRTFLGGLFGTARSTAMSTARSALSSKRSPTSSAGPSTTPPSAGGAPSPLSGRMIAI